jgi:hypothetical protein
MNMLTRVHNGAALSDAQQKADAQDRNREWATSVVDVLASLPVVGTATTFAKDLLTPGLLQTAAEKGIDLGVGAAKDSATKAMVPDCTEVQKAQAGDLLGNQEAAQRALLTVSARSPVIGSMSPVRRSTTRS